MVSFKFCKTRQNFLILFLSFIFISCSAQETSNQTSEVKESFKWRMVTTWPKKLSGRRLGS